MYISSLESKHIGIAWTQPDFDGGYPALRYIVQYKEVSERNWTPYNSNVLAITSTVVTGLTEGTEYELRVAAVNSVGRGPFMQIKTATLGK